LASACALLFWVLVPCLLLALEAGLALEFFEGWTTSSSSLTSAQLKPNREETWVVISYQEKSWFGFRIVEGGKKEAKIQKLKIWSHELAWRNHKLRIRKHI
jgi:hypothetical protein